MASSCTFRQLATLFGVSESTACDCVHALINVTVDHIMDKVICWPTDDECREISDMYEELNGFHNVIGFLDGTHIPIHKPSERGQDYYNRKDFYSI